MPRTILTFASVRLVIKADKILQANNIICKIIPVPEHISSECGMCIETNIENHHVIRNLLNVSEINHQITLLPA
jgi:hypothetical protein